MADRTRVLPVDSSRCAHNRYGVGEQAALYMRVGAGDHHFVKKPYAVGGFHTRKCLSDD